MLSSVFSRSVKEFRSSTTIGSHTETWNRKTSYLSASMSSGSHYLLSSWLTLDWALRRSSWRQSQGQKSTLLLSRLSFITTLMQLMFGLLASFLMRLCMELLSTQDRTTRKFSIKYWKCLSRWGIRTFVLGSRNFCFLFSRKNHTKDLLLQSFVPQSKKSLKKYKLKKLVKMKVKSTKTKRVNLVTRTVISQRTQAGQNLGQLIVPQNRMVWFRVEKCMKVELSKSKRRKKNCKKLGNRI